MKTAAEIEQEIALADKALDKGGIFFGMTYEEGVKTALEWVLGWIEERPMEE